MFIYFRERAQVRETAEGEGEPDSLLSKEPDMGLDPRTLRPRPKLKAVVQPTEPPRCPGNIKLLVVVTYMERSKVGRCRERNLHYLLYILP